MNIKKELEYMNFDDLKSICKELNVPYSYSKENTIEKLVKPIEKNYKMNNHKKSTELNINEYKKLNRNKSPIDTIIIGASVAGLSIANKLDNSIILESRMKVGGKTRTTYDKKGCPLYDDGPWRLHESHKRFQKILTKNGINFKKNNSYLGKHKKKTNTKCLKGLSTFGSNAYFNGIEEARKKNLQTGYDGMAYGDCSANVYHGQKNVGGVYYFVEGGMRKLVDALYENCKNRVFTKTYVEDINYDKKNKKYTVYYMTSYDGKHDKIECSKVILCAPPNKINFPSIMKWLNPLFASVESVQLMHVYAKLKNGKIPKNTYIVDPSNSNTQIISGDHSNFFQISYTSGDTALYMRDLYLNYKHKFNKLLTDNFYKYFPKDKYEIDVNSISVKYWDEAVHFWRPILNISGKTIKDMCNQSIEPHPTMLPNFFVCGETFSTHQGWLEGALETSEMVLKRLKHRKKRNIYNKVDKKCVLIDGRIIDVFKFKKIHPGSEKALTPYLGKDASVKYESIGHPKYSYSYLFQLQKGFLKI